MEKKDYSRGSFNAPSNFKPEDEVAYIPDFQHKTIRTRADALNLAQPGRVTRVIDPYVYVRLKQDDGTYGESKAYMPNDLWGITADARKL